MNDPTQMQSPYQKIGLWPQTHRHPMLSHPLSHTHPGSRRQELGSVVSALFLPVWCGCWTWDEVLAVDSSWEVNCGETERGREKENPVGSHQQPPDKPQWQQFLEQPFDVPWMNQAEPALWPGSAAWAVLSLFGLPLWAIRAQEARLWLVERDWIS
jgi:hypothetical protein